MVQNLSNLFSRSDENTTHFLIIPFVTVEQYTFDIDINDGMFVWWKHGTILNVGKWSISKQYMVGYDNQHLPDLHFNIFDCSMRLNTSDIDELECLK